MNPDYIYLLDGSFPPSSRVWIYQANRLLSLAEVFQAEEMLEAFTSQWKTHGTPVKGTAHIFFGQFFIIMADESSAGVSGCSTDSSVRVIKDIEEAFKLNMFDRTTLAFYLKEKVQMLPLNQLQYAVDNNFITPDTLYFNNTIQTRQDLENKWIIPVKESWLMKRLVVS